MAAFRVAVAMAGLVAFLCVPFAPVQWLGIFEFTVIALSWAWSARVRAGFTAERTVSELRVPRNDRLELVILATNKSRLPLYSFFFADTGGMLSVGADDARWLLTLPPRTTVPLRYSVVGSSRGDFEVGPMRFRGGDPLGLFPFEAVIEDRARVLVLPARVGIELAFDRGIPQGEVPLRDPRYEDVTLYRSIRDYRDGDELKRVNWKVTARLGRLCTNEYLDSLNSPVMVFCDLSAARYPLKLRRDVAERAIETAAALVSVAMARRQECGMASTGEGKPFFRTGVSRGQSILDALARTDLVPEREGSEDGDRELFARALTSLRNGGRFFYVGPGDPADLAGGSARFRRVSEYVHERKY